MQKILFTSIIIQLFLLLNSPLYSQESELSSPRQTMTIFLKSMKSYKQGEKTGLEEAIKTIDLSSLDQHTRKDSGKQVAIHLINTLDRIERVNINEIPNDLKKERWIYQQKEVTVDNTSYAVEISIQKNKNNEWLFSTETVSSIENYYNSLKNKKVVKGVIKLVSWKTRIKNMMPEWTGHRTFIILNGQWVGILLIIFIGMIIERFARFYFKKVVLKTLIKYEIAALTPAKEKKITFPFGMMALAGTFSAGIHLLELNDQFLSACVRGARIAFTVAVVILAHHLVDVVAMYFEKLADESENKFDDILVPMVKKTGKFFVIAVGVIAIGDSLALDMKSILTGLGIGGLAFALAAKDTLSNLFGSLTVLMDRPFRIGDWVTIGNIEGMVEEVGLRSTRVRTFYDSLITVPNGTLTNVHVDNYGQRRFRRLSTKLGVQYDTPPEKLEAFCEGIREIIRNHPNTRKDYFHVYFNSMGDFALEILLYVFFITPDWKVELQERHRLLMDILRLGNKMGVQFAFPTQTLHLFNEQHSPYTEIKESSLKEHGSKTAHAVTENNIQIDKNI